MTDKNTRSGICVNRRRFLAGASALAGGVLAVPAVLRARTPSGTLHLESWGGAYAEAVRSCLIERFQKQFDVEVEHRFFGNNSERLAKLKSGKSRIDLTFISSSALCRAGREELLTPLRVENVPHYERMFDDFKQPACDPWDEPRCISCFRGDQAIACNEQMVQEPPTSRAALWNPDYRGRVSFYGVQPGPMTNVALYLGQDPTRSPTWTRSWPSWRSSSPTS